MRGYILGLLTAFVLCLPGAVGAGTRHEAKQDLRIWQVRKVVRAQFEAEARLEHRVRLLECAGDEACISGENLAWQMLGSQWPGWPSP